MSWRDRWTWLRDRRQREEELDEELAAHLAIEIHEQIRRGVSPAEAERNARQAFGNLGLTKEVTRAMWGGTSLESTIRDLRYALRSLRKTPAFTITVILTLALGIGANSAVFSAINAVLLRPLPFPHGDRLVVLAQSQPQTTLPFVAPQRLEDWNRLNSTMTGVAGYYTEDATETSGEMPEKFKRAWITPRFLQVFEVAPELGRDFNELEVHVGGPPSVLISDRLWRRRFNADPNVLHKTVRLAGSSAVIIGVLPPSFGVPDHDVDIWSTAPPDLPVAQSREATWYTAVGRMKPGVTVAQVRANLATVQAGLGQQYPKTDAKISVLIKPLKDTLIGGIGSSLWFLFGSVSLLLLIACTNIAALLLSRATARQHEISVRFSLGASRFSVAAQLMSEVFLLAIAGSGLGLLVAAGAAQAFRSLAKDLPRLEEIRLDGAIVAYSLICAVVVTLLCGLIPAIRGTRRSLAGSLAQGTRSQVAGRNPLQFSLVGVQIALAVMLLAGAGLLLRSFQELGRVSPGFEPTHVLTFHISSTWAETSDWKGLMQRTQNILDGLRGAPGVEAATTSSSLPGVPGGQPMELKTSEGRADTEPKLLALTRWVNAGYFATIGVPLVAGELCHDYAATPEVMVNRSFANQYFNGAAAALGRHVLVPGQPFLPPSQIRGIVGDAREAGLDQELPPSAYWCTSMLQPGTNFLVRTRTEPAAMAETIRRRMHELEPMRSVYDLTPLTDHISDAYAEGRLRTVLLTFFALTAIGLAAVGLYGTLSYLVRVRQREVALRIALGALRPQVVRQFLGQGVRVAVLGCIAGVALALASGRILAGMLYGVTATDTVTLAEVVVLVLGVSALASLLPALRAARMDPMQLLREE